MFFALATAALYPEATPEQRAEYDGTLDGDSRRRCAAGLTLCPENHAHMQLLVEAECARCKARASKRPTSTTARSRPRVLRGISTSRRLAAELAGRFWLRDGKPEFAPDLPRQGAARLRGVGRDRQGRRPQWPSTAWGPASSATVSVTSSSTTLGPSAERSDALDLATLLKASQAIAGEIVLERLLVKLMDIIRENAGAESVVLVLESNGEFLVQGAKTAAGVARVLAGEPLRQSVACSTGIVNYVLRTSELVVLDDAAQQGKFRSDAYVLNRRPKSVLCAPVAHKGKLIGAVYLENNQVAGAFTPDRLEALNILMSQVAVSIENATLYSRQEQQSRAIEAANVTLTKEIAERKRAEGELSRYKDHLEDLVKERTRELEKAQGRLVDLSRRAGMAEVASGVLHNVGNVMNSVNVGASVAREAVSALPVEGRHAGRRAARRERAPPRRVSSRRDPVGRKLPDYLRKLGVALADEKRAILANIDQLAEHLEHMKKIIAAQQSYAKVNGLTEVCTLEEIAETALAISEGALRNSSIEVIRRYEKLPPVLVDRHQIMQILVNLISNAKHALEDVARPRSPAVGRRSARSMAECASKCATTAPE